MTSRLPLDDVLAWFGRLSTVPRASGHEQAVSDIVRRHAEAQGWDVHQDAAANLVIRKPAAAGAEGRRGLVLQGHLDMVAQKDEGSSHDFAIDPIVLVRDGDLLRAEGTTLGADNGMGVAIALAVLDSDLAHPPLEVLLTTGEETGLTGAKALAPGLLQGDLLLNLDVEQEGVFVTSSAGGETLQLAVPLGRREQAQGIHRVTVAGLRGGHSGLDIDAGRLNGVRTVSTLLAQLSASGPLRLASVDADGVFNVINREASATFAFPDADAVAAAVEALAAEVRRTEPDARVTLETLSASECLDVDDTGLLVRLLSQLPHGVHTRSAALGIVESSLNLAMVQTTSDALTVTVSVRSSSAEALQQLRDRVGVLATEAGATVTTSGAYPAWEFRADNPLQSLAERLYVDEFGRPARVTGVHGGLECGVLAAAYPQMAMLSLGADISDAHTPRERVSVSSVERLLRLVVRIVETIA